MKTNPEISTKGGCEQALEPMFETSKKLLECPNAKHHSTTNDGTMELYIFEEMKRYMYLPCSCEKHKEIFHLIVTKWKELLTQYPNENLHTKVEQDGSMHNIYTTVGEYIDPDDTDEYTFNYGLIFEDKKLIFHILINLTKNEEK